LTSARGFLLGALVAGGGLAWRGARMQRRQQRLVRELSATREQLDGMLANLSEAVTVTDRDRRIRYANQAAANLLGHASPEEVLAQPLGSIAARWESTLEDGRPMRPEDVPSWKIVHGLAAEPMLVRVVDRGTGERRWRLVKASPLRSRDGELLAVSVIEDVTEAKEAEQHQRFLAQAGETLASSLDYEETLQRVAQLAVPDLADWCVVDVLDAGGQLESVAIAHGDPEKVSYARELRTLYPPEPGDSGLYGVVQTGQPTLYAEIPDALLEQSVSDPERLEKLRAFGMRSVMLVPMAVAGRVIGTVTFVSAESGRSFDEDDLDFAGELARRAATAVANARLYRDREQAARTLQESLLPARLPSLPGWVLASSYAAGDTTAEVGGDFFDVVELDEGFMAIIGDVTGRGVEAAALTALARYTLATAARFDPSPSAVVRLLNDVLVERADISLLTVACAYILPTPTGAAMRLTSAGHPLPVLARAGTPPPSTIGPRGLLLGMSANGRWSEQVIELTPGDAVLFYTDGVTDTPSGRERFGEDRLLAAIAEAAGPVGMIESVQNALRDFQVGGVVDDRAMLALQLGNVAGAQDDDEHRTLPEASVI
jgi:serine phosphatase RsbU (regulator of sigma subunit)